MSLLAEGALELAASWVGFAQWREARGITDGSVRDLRARADELRRLVELYEPADSRIPPAQRDGEAAADALAGHRCQVGGDGWSAARGRGSAGGDQ